MHKLVAIVLMLAVTAGTCAYADEDYLLSIPSALNVSTPGWNDGGNITASSGKSITLKVTASSSNDFALKSEEGVTIGYTLVSRDGGAEVREWNFTKDELNASGGTSKKVGIMMSDYSGKPAGTYEDYITYTVSVDNVVPQYADQLAVTTHNGAEWSCMIMNEAGGFDFNGQTITSEQAVALAEYQAGITGNNCAVIYSGESVVIYFAKSDGTTGSGSCYNNADTLGLTGCTVYYVAN